MCFTRRWDISNFYPSKILKSLHTIQVAFLCFCVWRLKVECFPLEPDIFLYLSLLTCNSLPSSAWMNPCGWCETGSRRCLKEADPASALTPPGRHYLILCSIYCCLHLFYWPSSCWHDINTSNEVCDFIDVLQHRLRNMTLYWSYSVLTSDFIVKDSVPKLP